MPAAKNLRVSGGGILKTEGLLLNDTVSERKRFSKRLTWVSLYGLISLGINMIMSIAVAILGLRQQPMLYYLAHILFSFFSVLFPALLVGHISGGIRKSMFRKEKKTGFIDSLLLLLFGIGASLSLNYIMSIISALFPFTRGSSSLSSGGDSLSFIMLIITSAATPAICEELAHRGFSFGTLRNSGGMFAAVVSSLIFGMMHGGISTMFFAFFSGLIFCMIRIHSGRLWLSMLVHFFNNAYAASGSFLYAVIGRSSYRLIIILSTDIAILLMITMPLLLYVRDIKVLSFTGEAIPSDNAPEADNESEHSGSQDSKPEGLSAQGEMTGCSTKNRLSKWQKFYGTLTHPLFLLLLTAMIVVNYL